MTHSLAALYQEISTWSGFTVVKSATWEEDLMVRLSNHKHTRSLSNMARKGTVLLNQDLGSGAESLHDQRLSEVGISTHQLNGYERIVGSHLKIARLLANGNRMWGSASGQSHSSSGSNFSLFKKPCMIWLFRLHI
jgi:molybdate-binding protein